MDRLTARDPKTGFAYYPRCYEEPCFGMGCENENCEMHQLICEKLAKYEDEEEKQKWHVVADGDMPKTEDGTSNCYLVTDGRYRWLAYPKYDKNWDVVDWIVVEGEQQEPIDWTEIIAWMPLPEPPKEHAKQTKEG